MVQKGESSREQKKEKKMRQIIFLEKNGKAGCTCNRKPQTLF
jgi:hypothetical protein